MPEQEGGFGGALYKRLTGQGISRGQIYRALALQRLGEDVARLGREHNLPESVLIEISKIKNPTAQKQILEVVIERSLSLSWTRELSRLIRYSEGLDTDEGRSRVWDFFFKIRDHLADEGATRPLMKKLREFREALEGAAEAPDIEVLETEEERARKIIDLRTVNLSIGKGLDVGTANIVAGVRALDTGDVIYNIQRNAFLDMRDDKFTKKYLAKLNINYTAHQNRLYVIGDPAFELANVFEKDARRPMKDGMISPYEPEALVIVDQLIHQLMGPPQVDGEICAVSVPAAPIDMERDNIYHQGVLESLLSRNGYRPKAVLEGQAIVFAELSDTSYTGIGISCGGGMFNVCVSYKSIVAAAFSTSRGGDWIDQSVGKAVGLAGSQVAGIKESGISILRPKARVEEAIAIYYRNLIRYTIEHIRRQIESSDSMPDFGEAIPIVFAGGTSMIGDFIEITRQEIEKVKFPFELSDIRLAPDPLHTVAKGCLTAALQESDAMLQGKAPAPKTSPFQVRDIPKRAQVSRRTLEKLGAIKGPETSKPAERSAPAAVETETQESGVRQDAEKNRAESRAEPETEKTLPESNSDTDTDPSLGADIETEPVAETEEEEAEAMPEPKPAPPAEPPPPSPLELIEEPEAEEEPSNVSAPPDPPRPAGGNQDDDDAEVEPLEEPEEESIQELVKGITDPALEPVEDPADAEVAELDEDED
jgi:hypothetical protein